MMMGDIDRLRSALGSRRMRIRPHFHHLPRAGTALSAAIQRSFIGDESIIYVSRAHEKLTTSDDRK
jgi:hypothetical protein